MKTLFWRLVFADWETLRDYLAGRDVRVQDILRRLFLAERDLNHRYPDHYYKNIREFNLGARERLTISDLVWGGLNELAEYFLVPHRNQIVVANERFAEWQHHLPRISPLATVSSAILRNFGPPPRDPRDREAYFQRHVSSQFAASALPTVFAPGLEDLIRQDGLYDLHIHLNGSTELDRLWLDVLRRPDEFYRQLSMKQRPEGVLEQYAQIEPDLTPDSLYQRIKAARRLRAWLCEVAFGGGAGAIQPLELVREGRLENQDFEARRNLHRHPAQPYLPTMHEASELACEAWMLIHLLRIVEGGQNDALARALHCYLLILGSFTPLCVQQVEQFGFDQFQKFTLNEVREMSEKAYHDRFVQLDFSNAGDVQLLEGRFAPKQTEADTIKLLRRILAGFASFHGIDPTRYDLSQHSGIPTTRRMDLRLVAHFIKAPDGNISRLGTHMRFRELRDKTARQLRLLSSLRDQYPGIRHYVTGIDVAANELDTPPEVFAPLFRSARMRGFRHFTYHVGEDFEHLLSGIRAVFEALYFLDLGPGDRLGHATAIGIAPTRWLERTPKRLARRQGDWLDDLVFAHRFLLATPAAAGILPRLESEIERLSRVIYRQSLPPSLLYEAWELRQLNPRWVLERDRTPEAVLEPDERAEYQRCLDAERDHPPAYAVFRSYHQSETVRASQTMMRVETGLLSAELLASLQESVLEEVLRRQVVLEALMTSNVRISLYDDYHEHHLFRWLGHQGSQRQPVVCLGTDDPGIFATNLRNEYAHVLRELREKYGKSDSDALETLRQLNRNGRIYGFLDAGNP